MPGGRHNQSVRRRGRHKRLENASCRDPLAQCVALRNITAVVLTTTVQSAGTHWLSMGQKTSLTGKVKLFSADRRHHAPAPEGGMSGLPCLPCCACWSLWLAGPCALSLLAAVLADSRFPQYFCVTSEADRGTVPRTGKFLVRYSRKRRSLTVISLLHAPGRQPQSFSLWPAVSWDFGSLYHEALRRHSGQLLRQRHTGSVRMLWRPRCSGKYSSQLRVPLSHSFQLFLTSRGYGRCRLR